MREMTMQDRNQPQKFEPSQPPTPEMAQKGFWMVTCHKNEERKNFHQQVCAGMHIPQRMIPYESDEDFAVMVCCQTAQTAKEVAQTFLHKSTSELQVRFWSREEYGLLVEAVKDCTIPAQFECFNVLEKYVFTPRQKKDFKLLEPYGFKVKSDESSDAKSSFFYEVEMPSGYRDVWRVGLLKG